MAVTGSRACASLLAQAIACAGALSACAPASDTSAAALTDTVTAEARALFGELEGPPEYLFGRVNSVATDDRGVVYVADGIASTVRSYDQGGAFLGTVGGEGEGPGEFTRPLDLVLDPAGRLYVRDMTRLTVLERSGESAWPDSVVRVLSLGRFMGATTRAATDGVHYYMPSYYYWAFLYRDWFYEVIDSTGLTGDTVRVHGLPDPTIFGRANYVFAHGRGGQPLEGVSTGPFEAVHRWTISPQGHVFLSPGDRYDVVELDADGDTVRVIRRPMSSRPIPAAERADSVRAFRARIDTIPVRLSDVNGMSEAARSGAVPDVLPEVVALFVDLSGNLWVRRWPPEGETSSTFFDVFDRGGAPLGTVRVPALLRGEPAPWLSLDRVVGVVDDEATGIERIGVFTVTGLGIR